MRRGGLRVSSRIISEMVVGEEGLKSRINQLSNAEEVNETAIECCNSRRQ